MTVADIAQRLHRRGLVERNRDPGDRRRLLLTVPASGVACLAEVGRRQPAVEELFLTPLEEAQRSAFVGTLRTIATSVSGIR